MATIKKKFIGSNQVDGSKISLLNEQSLKGKDSLGGDVNILKIDSSGRVQLQALPQVSSDPSAGNDISRKSYVDSKSAAEAAAAAAAVIQDSITDGITNKAPSQNAVYDALALKVSSSEKGAAFGVASLGSDGKVPSAQLPAIAINDTYVVASEAAMLALTAQVGDIAVRTDISKTFILAADPASTLSNWVELLAAGQVVSVNGYTGAVTLSKSDVGLGNVDNTSDLNKPISTATQNALNAKLSLSGGTMTGAISMSNLAKITDLVDGSSAKDAINKSQLDSAKSSVDSSSVQEMHTLSAGDITNGYIDLGFEAAANSIVAFVDRLGLRQGYDFGVSLVGGVTRMTWIGDVASGGPEALAANDEVFVCFRKKVSA